mgnify:CR=1 FL=1
MNIDKIKKEFPIFDEKIQNNDLVYLDSANSSQKPKVVIDRINEFYTKEFSNVGRSVHYLAVAATNLYENTRTSVKKFINAKDKNEIVFTKGATEALNLVANTLGQNYLQEGDEVLTTALTCTATNWPIPANNLKIKWVDVDPKTLNLDLNDLRRKITSKTKVIMVVHWGGYPNDLDELKKIQRETKGLYGFEPMIIEDCAHAFGSTYKKEPIGSHGNICTFSFQAIKHLTTVDGGLLVCPNQKLYDRGKLIRWYGIDRNSNRKDFRCEADIKEWGFKFHMNDVCATIGIENLKKVDEVIRKHKENAV